MSTNIHKFECVFRGPGNTNVGGKLLSYGDVFYLPADQLQRVKVNDIVTRKIAYRGEVDDNDSVVSTAMLNYIRGKGDAVKRNFWPMVTLDIDLDDTAFDTPATVALAYLRPRRSMALHKVSLKAAVLPSDGNGSGTLNIDNQVSMLLTKGDPGATPTQITTYGYLDDAGVMTSLGLPDTGTVIDAMVAATDKIYLGNSEKFSGVYVDMTATPNSNASVISTIKYYNGSTWVEFDNVNDLTQKAGATLAQSGWIAWYEFPSNWEKSTVSGSVSGTTEEAYWVQIVVSGNLDADTEIERIVIPDDQPVVGMDVVLNGGDFDAIVLEDDTTLSDVTSDLATGGSGLQNMLGTQWAAADDAMYFGSAAAHGGLTIDVGTTVNDAVSTMTVSYWNGFEWVDTSATDGTNSVADTMKVDGTVTFAIPADWRKAAASSTVLGATPPTTISTDELYWLKLVVDGNLTPSFDLDLIRIARSAQMPIEFEAPVNTYIAASDYLNLYVGEVEAETDALSGVELQLIGIDV